MIGQSLFRVNDHANLSKYLANSKAQPGDYIKIKLRDFEYSQIAQIKELSIPVKNSRMSRMSIFQSESQYQCNKEWILKGSKMFLRNENLNECEFELIKPLFPNSLYVQLFAGDQRKYLCLVKGQINFQSHLDSNILWVCTKINRQKQEVAIFMQGEYYLMIDGSGKFQASNFHSLIYQFKIVQEYGSYTLKLNDHLKNFQCRISIQKNETSCPNIKDKINYAERLIKVNPSLCTINMALSELLIEEIPQFQFVCHKISVQHQQLLAESGISQLIRRALLNVITSEKAIQQEVELKQSLKLIGWLCSNSEVNSHIFMDVIEYLIEDVSRWSHHICLLLYGNPYYFGKYGSKWHSQILKQLLQQSLPISTFHVLPYLQIFKAACNFRIIKHNINNNSNCSCHPQRDRTPHVPNQYLIYHTMQLPEVKQTNLFLDMYNEGSYIFISEGKAEVQLNTYLQEDVRSSNSEGKIRLSNKQSNLTFAETKAAAVQSQLELLTAICSNNNINCLKYAAPVSSLLSYCYKTHFPILQNQNIVSAILQLSGCYLNQTKNVDSLYNRHRFQFVTANKESKWTAAESQARPFAYKLHQIPIRTLKQIAIYFLGKVDKVAGRIKMNPKNLQNQVYENSIQGWLCFFKLVLENRLISVKHKKQTQFVQYIMKIFQSVDNRDSKTSQRQKHQINSLFYLLASILKYKPGYDEHLKALGIRRNYQEANNWASMLKSSGNEVGSSGLHEIGNLQLGLQNGWTEVQLKAAQTLKLLYLNTNQQCYENATNALIYYVRNPTVFSSFSLSGFQPTYYEEQTYYNIILQSWYLAGPPLFDQLTTLLRLLFSRNAIFSRDIKSIVFLSEEPNPNLLDFNILLRQAKLLKMNSETVNSWLYLPLLDKYHEPYTMALNHLHNTFLLLSKARQLLSASKFQQLVYNIQILKVCKLFLVHIDRMSSQDKIESQIDAILIEIRSILSTFVKATEQGRPSGLYSMVGMLLGEQLLHFPLFLCILVQLYVLPEHHELLLQLNPKFFKQMCKIAPDCKELFAIWLYTKEEILEKLCQRLMREYIQSLREEQRKQFIEGIFNDQKCRIGYQGCPNYCKIVENYNNCAIVFHFIAYRLLQIKSANNAFLEWYEIEVIPEFMCRSIQYLDGNPSNQINDLQNKSYLATLIALLAEPRKQGKKHMTATNKQNWTTLFVEYLYKEFEPTITLNPQINQIKYYLYDLIPLVRFLKQVDFNQKLVGQLKSLLKQLKDLIQRKQLNKQLPQRLEALNKMLQSKYFHHEHLQPRPISIPVIKLTRISSLRSSTTVIEQKWEDAKQELTKTNIEKYSFIDHLSSFNIYGQKASSTSKFLVSPYSLQRKLLSSCLNWVWTLQTRQNIIFLLHQLGLLVAKIRNEQDKKKKGNNFRHPNEIGCQLLAKCYSSMLDSQDFSNLPIVYLALEIVRQSGYCSHPSEVSCYELLKIFEFSHRYFHQYQGILTIAAEEFASEGVGHPLTVVVELFDQLNMTKLSGDYINELYQQLLQIQIEIKAGIIFKEAKKNSIAKLKSKIEKTPNFLRRKTKNNQYKIEL